MGKFLKTILFSSFLIISICSAQQQCENYAFSNNQVYTTCNALPVLNSFLHYTYHQANHTVNVAYRHTGMSTSDWVAWGLNLGSGRMLGAQCLVGFQNSSGLFSAYTSPIGNTYQTTLSPGDLSFPVPSVTGEFRNGEMIIYATIQLPSGQTSYTHVWQFGPVSGSTLGAHDMATDNRRSFGTIDFASGATSDTGLTSGSSRDRNRNIHGVLNVVSWGIMLPVGAILARYLKVFKAANPLWFYIHVTCQTSAYIIGVAGWGTGLKLGSDSVGIVQDVHRNIGITLFALGTLQVFALLLRPKPDHKFRFYWNIYHHAVGYAVISLSIVNIFEGLDILDPEQRWRSAYIGVLIFLGACVLVLEPLTWVVVLKRKRDADKEPHAHSGNGSINGHGA